MYRRPGDYHPKHDGVYNQFDFTEGVCTRLQKIKPSVCKAIINALLRFTDGTIEKPDFWKEYLIKKHVSSQAHIIRPRVSIQGVSTHEWRIIVMLYPETETVEVIVVSAVRDYKHINEEVRKFMKEVNL